MLPSLSPLERGRLRMSVGYGHHRTGRPLSPLEVSNYIQAARRDGASLQDCAEALQLSVSQIERFLRILRLDESEQHCVDWGSGDDFIGFSTAVEMARLKEAGDQQAVAQAVLSERLTSKEVREIVQLRTRSERPIQTCIDEIVGMRPIIERRYVFIGSNPPDACDHLNTISQQARDKILSMGIANLGLGNAKGRLGPKHFTLVGDEEFNSAMTRIGKGKIEPLLRTQISEALALA
ncbi:MAG: hypothetical protein OXD33_10045 [Rhodobacteraceae bacterium]|nr:hypothetical protein [Paracoccaceae bacterium]